jgi:acetyl/propionyl-CoA carboxylase alpha subunit/acetyl-CoA carboxylase carboxyltransferase component
VNRGEAAMRLIHAVRELNAATGHEFTTIALYTDDERHSMFVREADTAYRLGPASARPYLDPEVLERALRDTGAELAWVGWGFVAEDPAFADLCERIGVVFVGPTAEAMRSLGDKIGAKRLAERAGVPVAAWSDGPVDDLAAARTHASRIGYPLMLKASAGGGGRGIRVITSEAELAAVFGRTRAEAGRAFGRDEVFLEKLVTGARHVEVQLLGDGQGRAWALGVRDCSVQRRNQKVLEESASPVLRPDEVAEIKAAAVRLALTVDYRGAGTAEFLFSPEDRSFAFLEVNTRLQVEHPVTELATGTDLVRWQLLVATGETLPDTEPEENGYAIEARLNAEDPDRDFTPAPGRIALLRLPVGPGVRVDTGVSEQDEVPAEFDSMIAKVIGYGRTRTEALARLRRALEDTVVVIEGGTTNKSFLLSLLDQPDVIEGRADTGWIDRVTTTGNLVNHRNAGAALAAAAIDAYDAESAMERRAFLQSAHGGRPEARHEPGRAFDLKLRGQPYHVEIAQLGRFRFRFVLDGTSVQVEREQLSRFTARLTIEGRSFRVITATHATAHVIDVDGAVHRIYRDEGGLVRAPAPALVVALPLPVGSEVTAGSPIAVLESMKMETAVPAPFSGQMGELLVAPNEQVGAGQPLCRLIGGGNGSESANGPGALAPELPEPVSVNDPKHRMLDDLTEMLSLILGYDVLPEESKRTVARYQQSFASLDAHDPELLRGELAVLTVFADVCELTRNRPLAEDSSHERVHSPREFFHAYLRSLDVEREHLPQSFRDKLTRTLKHYEITELERTTALEDVVFRVFLSQQQATAQLPVIAALLERWLAIAPPRSALAQRAYEVLDRLVLATQLRYPLIGDLSRSVRYRWFEAPVVESARNAAYTSVREQLRYLTVHLPPADYDSRIETLVASPEPVVRFLAERIAGELPEHEPLLEVLTRRHYREHTLQDLTSGNRDGRPVVTADYTLDETPRRLISTVASTADLTAAASMIDSVLTELPRGHQGVVDLYLSWPDAPPDADDCFDGLRERLDALEFAHRVRRVAVAISTDEGDRVHQFTVRPGPEGTLVEDRLVRGLHPMVARRLDLWRLRDFRVTRLETPDDVLLYSCVAPDNESDIRLVALAQVRELSIVRDHQGNVASLPQVERAIAGCMDAIRKARKSGQGLRMNSNHIWLYIWPVIEAPISELISLHHTVGPVTRGAGIQEVSVQGRVAQPDGILRPIVARFAYQQGSSVVTSVTEPSSDRLEPLDDYAQKVVRARRRGTVYPYEIVPLLSGGDGEFIEYDLDEAGRLAPVDRPRGGNSCGIVVGICRTPTARYPEGMTRVAILGDPTKSLGAVSEPECSRIVAALDLAESRNVPVEWFAISSGARISMENGTENMDWVARALRRIITFTQNGGEINIVVTGINVGAQPYWNAEATMLMHTRGILVMTPDSAMVLTGKTSLDYSGGVSAEDNFGIGGYDRVMGPNGQAQYWAPTLAEAVAVLFSHYEHAYVAPGERAVRPVTTNDPEDRDVTVFPHSAPGSDFTTVGDIFSETTNPERKKPFDIRSLMQAVRDSDHEPLERWAGMAEAETSVVLDAHLGGQPVCLIGIESRPIPRRGFPPSDGPDTWTAGTLFPRSSKKTARAINAASGSRPVVVLANLSGFDGSPESMRTLQLEYGAEIGRAVVNFSGPIVFCVVSRYHGGAFVVFSRTLHDNLQVLAVAGSYASVIGGAPAAGVVFTGEVAQRTGADPRLKALELRLMETDELERARLRAELNELRAVVRSEKVGEVAAEFDAVHSIDRAVRVGSVDAVIPADRLRPELIQAVRRGLARAHGPRE